MSKKLWTGKTARQELFSFVQIRAAASDWDINDAFESVLDGAEGCPDGSLKREMLRYWEGLDWRAQGRLISEIRAAVRRGDRLAGLKIQR